MKQYLLTAILPLVMFCSTARGLTPAPESLVDVVADVIKHDDWGSGKSGQMFGSVATDLMRSHFSDAFVKDWNRIAKAAKNDPYLYGDVLTGSQGISDVTFDSARVKSKSDMNAEVEATFHYFEDEVEGRPKKAKSLSFYLVKENGLWKVDDFEYVDEAVRASGGEKLSPLKPVKSTFRKFHKQDH